MANCKEVNCEDDVVCKEFCVKHFFQNAFHPGTIKLKVGGATQIKMPSFIADPEEWGEWVDPYDFNPGNCMYCGAPAVKDGMCMTHWQRQWNNNRKEVK